MIIRDSVNDEIIVISSSINDDGLIIHCYSSFVDFVFLSPTDEKYDKYNIDNLKCSIYENKMIKEIMVTKKDMIKLTSILRQLANERKQNSTDDSELRKNYSYVMVEEDEIFEDQCFIGLHANDDVDHQAADFLNYRLFEVSYSWNKLLEEYWMNNERYANF